MYGRAILFNKGESPLQWGYLTGESLPQPGTVSDECEWQIWDGFDWLEAMCESCNNCILSPEAIVRTRLQRELGGYREDLPHTADWEMSHALGRACCGGNPGRGSGILSASPAQYVPDVSRLNGAEQAKMVFDTFLYHYGHCIAGRERLQKLAAIAGRLIHALNMAYWAFREGNVQGCRELIGSTIRTCPDARNLKLYQRLIWMMAWAPRLGLYIAPVAYFAILFGEGQ